MNLLFLVISLFPLLALSAELPVDPTVTKGDVIANPSGNSPDLPETNTVAGWQKGFKQTLQLKMKDLDVTANFPLNSRHAFQVSGYDNLDHPYKLEVKTTKSGDDTFKVDYKIVRGEKNQSGSVTVKKGSLGKAKLQTKDILDPEVIFETKISN